LQRLNKENTNIISVEDPIEMDIEGVNQIQTNSEIGLDFATVLRSILRQDPNIIMIGEIRDTETAKIAVRASITGHLVLSTIHTNDSLNTIERLLDMDVERYLLASALTGIISQKLARRLCPHCRKLRPTNDYEKNIIHKVTGKVVNEIYSANGCEQCKNGYNGRIAIHEVLLIDQDIKDAISSNIRKDKLRKLVYNGSVISLLQDGISKVLEGYTTLEELLKIIELDEDSKVNPTGLQNAIEDNELNKENSKNDSDDFDKPDNLPELIDHLEEDLNEITPTIPEKNNVQPIIDNKPKENIIVQNTNSEPVVEKTIVQNNEPKPIEHNATMQPKENIVQEQKTENNIKKTSMFSSKKKFF